MLRSQVQFARYFEVKIEERRTQRQDDLISDLVYARLEDGTGLPDAEMLGMFAQLLVAGYETTAKLWSAKPSSTSSDRGGSTAARPRRRSQRTQHSPSGSAAADP